MRFTIDDKEYSLRFQHDHDRLIYGKPDSKAYLTEKQGPLIGVGMTTCIIDQVEGHGEATKVIQTYTGEAACSLKDEWNRRTGRRISLARAFKALATDRNLSHEARAEFWATYFARTKKEAFRP